MKEGDAEQVQPSFRQKGKKLEPFLFINGNSIFSLTI